MVTGRMTDPNTATYYAHKILREQDGTYYYYNAHTSRMFVKLHYYPNPIVKVSVRERVATDPPSNYWGWLDAMAPHHYIFVWPSEVQLDMCFPYGPKVEEDRGRGRKVNLVVEELPEGA